MMSRTQFPTRHHGAKNLDKGTGLWWRVRSGEQDKEDLIVELEPAEPAPNLQ
jgi:hypothetical protein